MAVLSLMCSWNAAVLVNCDGFAIEVLRHLNGAVGEMPH